MKLESPANTAQSPRKALFHLNGFLVDSIVFSREQLKAKVSRLNFCGGVKHIFKAFFVEKVVNIN